MYRYFLSLGSNIEPEHNTRQMLRAMLTSVPALWVSRILCTNPVGVDTPNCFYNLSVAFESDLPADTLKRCYVSIEVALGRDRTDPNRRLADRVADIDILFWQDARETRVDPARLPTHSYDRPQLVELIHGMGLDLDEPVDPHIPEGVRLDLNGQRIGDGPMLIHAGRHPARGPRHD